MAGSVNRVILIGRLGKDPEARKTQDGKLIINLRLATSESWKDRNSGERKEKTEWHSVVIFNEHAAKFADQYLKKGALVYVDGALQTRKWQDKTGEDRYSTEVVVSAFSGTLSSLDGAKSNDVSRNDDEPRREKRETSKPQSSFDKTLDEDSIPF